MMMPRRRRHGAGFTIVELIVVIIVIAILATIGYVWYDGAQDRAREAVVRSDLLTAAELLNTDKVRSGGKSFPSSVANADRGNGLVASKGTTYQYSVNNGASPPTFCLTATNGITKLFITESTQPEVGACPGHS